MFQEECEGLGSQVGQDRDRAGDQVKDDCGKLSGNMKGLGGCLGLRPLLFSPKPLWRASAWEMPRLKATPSLHRESPCPTMSPTTLPTRHLPAQQVISSAAGRYQKASGCTSDSLGWEWGEVGLVVLQCLAVLYWWAVLLVPAWWPTPCMSGKSQREEGQNKNLSLGPRLIISRWR